MKTTAAEKRYSGGTLYMAFDLGWQKWELAFTAGLGQKPRLRSMPARSGPAGTRRLQRRRSASGCPP